MLPREWGPDVIKLIQHSDTATRRGINNTIPDEQLPTWQAAWEKILLPIVESLGEGIEITSGYRCPKLNKAIGGSKNSQHRGFFRKPRIGGRKRLCAAFDIKPVNMTALVTLPQGLLLNVARQFMEGGAPIDQLIDEYHSWVHISFLPEEFGPRRVELKKYTH